MSPEQARGQPVDKRTDIWAFGCVLYEMLTGRRAFAGDSLTDTLAHVIEREPDWRALPETTPDVVRRLLERCLRKDVRRRLRDIADARIEIDDAIAAPTGVGADRPHAGRIRSAAAGPFTPLGSDRLDRRDCSRVRGGHHLAPVGHRLFLAEPAR